MPTSAMAAIASGRTAVASVPAGDIGTSKRSLAEVPQESLRHLRAGGVMGADESGRAAFSTAQAYQPDG